MPDESPPLQFEGRIDETAEHPVVQLTLTNIGSEPIVLDEIGAVREDGVSFLVSEPCGTELAPAETWPFEVPLAHLDGSQGPRTIGILVRVSDVDDEDVSTEWPTPSSEVVFATDFRVARTPQPDDPLHRLLMPMSGQPLSPESVAALRAATSIRDRSDGQQPVEE